MALNKRERMLALLADQVDPSYVPAGFFLHFPGFESGRAAVAKHCEFFDYTDMDFVKVQFEAPWTIREEIVEPGDWASLPIYGQDFYQGQLDVVEGLVKERGDQALILMTLYSPYMCAMKSGRRPNEERLDVHLRQDADAAKVGIERAYESLMVFVRGCIDRGVDGFYACTQGGEPAKFEDPAVFAECIKPWDLKVMQEINERCRFNILHVCDFRDLYADLTPYLEYPGDVVNTSLELIGDELTARQVSEMFGMPFMGGMDRLGPLSRGDLDAIRKEARACLEVAPAGYVLAADCTVPNGTSWEGLKAAIEVAHQGID